jgi:hypothetical protein
MNKKDYFNFEPVHPVLFILMYWIYLLPSTQQTLGYNWVYNDMFRLTRVIVRLRSEPLNVFSDYVHFGIQKGLQCYQLLTYNHYLKVLWLCVSLAVSRLEYCPVLLLYPWKIFF